jgi:sporulation protein YlmC with PRC-barrel domain
VKRKTIRLEDLLGQKVVDAHGARVGRIEEVRAERRGDVHEVTEYLLGPGALIERMAITARLFRRTPRTYVVRWDQLDVANPHRPALTCDVSELHQKH